MQGRQLCKKEKGWTFLVRNTSQTSNKGVVVPAAPDAPGAKTGRAKNGLKWFGTAFPDVYSLYLLCKTSRKASLPATSDKESQEYDRAKRTDQKGQP